MPAAQTQKKFIKKMAILVSIETTAGTMVVPTATGAIEVMDVTLTPMESSEVEYNVMRPYFGATEVTQVNVYRGISFSVGLAGVATKGQLPGYSTLIRACGASATSITAPVGSEKTVFAPVTDGQETITIHAVIDKMLYKMAGTRGNSKATVDNAGMPKWTFDFMGDFLPVEDVASMPTVDYTKFLRPLAVSFDNTTATLDGVTLALSNFAFDFGNAVAHMDMPGYTGTDINDRKSTGSLTFRNMSVATKNWVGMAKDGAKVALALKHGQAATNTVAIDVARAQLGKPSFGEADGIQTITIPFRCIPSSAGNDEWSITV